eukprot:NODE_94_length_21515_cov_0.130417.p11 type:complete len:148 gc:universal NODE_94_length_21515_cov_0.130417:719-276(-)
MGQPYLGLTQNFAPIIKKMVDMVNAEKNGSSKYFILMITTDGEITDMDATVDVIIDACNCPLSIVIVGVGNADFSKMKLLDGDQKPLSLNGRTASRDIVQFVAMRDFQPEEVNMRLPASLLEEIPQQVVEYMNSNGYEPYSSLGGFK